MRLLITGSPCSGKTTLGLAVSKLIDCPLVKLNDVVGQAGCFELNERGEKEVDLRVLEKHLKKVLSKFAKKDLVVEGHLLCEMRLPCEKIAVLRANPRLLLKRMKKRRYGKEKIAENLLAEILDYFLIYAEQNYGKPKTVQVNASKSLSAEQFLASIGRGKSEFVDWTPLLLEKGFAREISRFA